MTLAARFSKLRQRLKEWAEALEKLPPKQRLTVLGVAGVLLVLLIYAVVISPLMTLEESWAQELDKKMLLLHKYQALKNDKQAVAKTYRNFQKALAQAEGQLLSGTNPAVASADLQEILKNLTKTLGVQVNSTKVLPPKESKAYLEVPIEVQMSCTIDQLIMMLYRLEHHNKLLLVTQLDVNAPRRRRPGRDISTLRAHLVVEGLMKKSAEG